MSIPGGIPQDTYVLMTSDRFLKSDLASHHPLFRNALEWAPAEITRGLIGPGYANLLLIPPSAVYVCVGILGRFISYCQRYFVISEARIFHNYTGSYIASRSSYFIFRVLFPVSFFLCYVSCLFYFPSSFFPHLPPSHVQSATSGANSVV